MGVDLRHHIEFEDAINTRPDLVLNANFGWLIVKKSIFNFGRIVLTSTPFPGRIPMKYGSSYAIKIDKK